MLVVLLRPLIGGFEGRRLAISLAQVAAGCAVLAAVSWATWTVLAGQGAVRLDLRHYTALAASLLLAGLAFMATEFALSSREASVAVSVFLRRRVAEAEA